MMQNGTRWQTGRAKQWIFSASLEKSGKGISAFDFYLGFSSPQSGVYTWSDSLQNAREEFLSGDVAMIFDYARELAGLEQKAPFLRIGIAQMPQPEGAISG